MRPFSSKSGSGRRPRGGMASAKTTSRPRGTGAAAPSTGRAKVRPVRSSRSDDALRGARGRTGRNGRAATGAGSGGTASGAEAFLPRRRRSPRAVRRGVLAALLLGGLLLVTMSIKGGQLDGPRRVALSIAEPAESGLSRAWAPISSAYDWVGRLTHATSNEPKLHARIRELEQHQAAARLAERDNETLRDLVAIKDRGTFPDGYDQVSANVVARSTADRDGWVVLDVGTKDGIEVDDPVMVARGLIGRVSSVTSNAARVSLLLNRTEAVTAMDVQGDVSGVLRAVVGDGAPVFDLSYVPQRVAVHEGDEIVTSGFTSGDLRSVFPKGVPVGYVSSVGGNPADLYTSIQVTPWADFDRIDAVLVLTRKDGTPAPIDPETLAKLRSSSNTVARSVSASDGQALSPAALAAADKAARAAAAKAEAKAKAKAKARADAQAKAAIAAAAKAGTTVPSGTSAAGTAGATDAATTTATTSGGGTR